MYNNYNNDGAAAAAGQNENSVMDVNNTTIGGNSNATSNFKRGQSCTSVMIAHLNRYGQNLEIWGTHTNLITFVGIVKMIDAVSTKVHFEFEDETGTIKGIKWLDANAVPYETLVRINSYARVYGMMRNQHEQNFVLVVDIGPVEHLNELLAHLMEVTATCLEAEKIVNKVTQSNYSFVDSLNTTDIINVSNNGSTLDVSRAQAVVLNIIKNSDPKFGAERGDIKSRVPAALKNQVDEILEFLSGEGHIYTTKTEDHFKLI